MSNGELNKWVGEEIRSGGKLVLLDQYIGNVLVGIFSEAEDLLIAIKDADDGKLRITSFGLKSLTAFRGNEQWPTHDIRNAGEHQHLPRFIFPFKGYSGGIELFVGCMGQSGKKFVIHKE